jgi:signal transduction histidine kinase
MDVHGAVFLVDSRGEVSRVFVNNIQQFQIEDVGLLTELMEASSKIKFQHFFKNLVNSGAAENWEFLFKIKDQFRLFLVSGVKHQEGYMIILAENKEDTWHLAANTLGLSSQQMDFIEECVTDLPPQDEYEFRDQMSYFDEICRLNNELVNLHRIIIKQKNDLEHLNEQKDYFMGMAAHDLHNPLWAIKYFSDILKSDLVDALSDQQEEYLEIISSSSRFMLDLVEDLLDVTTISSGELILDLLEVDLGQLLNQVVRLNQALADQKDIQINLSQEVDPGLKIPLDPDRFQQVINNLLSNAIKFSPRGESINIVYTADKDQVCVQVQDNGPGIPEDELDQLFQLFRKTSVVSPEGKKSSGLGLAIARKIINAHQGDLRVNSIVGEGTEFSVYLPIENVKKIN